ncbi:MAG: hypothetical protein DDT22_01189 [candidate division WS2 bacterium]|nr:hypothetical protein [Candidatus Lithacetigena glycinireducens]
MNRYYTLEEVRAIRDEISRLGEGNFDELREKLSKARVEWYEELQRYKISSVFYMGNAKGSCDEKLAREVKDE